MPFAPARSGPIVVPFGNPKGGTGKTFLCTSFTGWAVYHHNVKTTLIECDIDNRDCLRRFNGSIPTVEVDVRADDGWSDLINTIEQIGDGIITINLPSNIARLDPKTRVSRFEAVQSELNGHVIMTWVLDATENSALFLRSDMNIGRTAIPSWFAIRNLKHGPPESFFWTETKTRAWFLQHGYPEADFPSLFPQIAKLFSTYAYADLRNATVDLKLGDRLSLRDWFAKSDEFWDLHAAIFGLAEIVTRNVA